MGVGTEPGSGADETPSPVTYTPNRTRYHKIINQTFPKIYLCDKVSMRHLGESEKKTEKKKN